MRDYNRRVFVYCSGELMAMSVLSFFLFGIEVVGERDADVVVQGVLPLVGLLIGGLAASSVFFPDTSNNTAEINSNWQIIPL